jgi:hypothetical protein
MLSYVVVSQHGDLSWIEKDEGFLTNCHEVRVEPDVRIKHILAYSKT